MAQVLFKTRLANKMPADVFDYTSRTFCEHNASIEKKLCHFTDTLMYILGLRVQSVYFTDCAWIVLIPFFFEEEVPLLWAL